jgi:hypothetical protein
MKKKKKSIAEFPHREFLAFELHSRSAIFPNVFAHLSRVAGGVCVA